MSVFISPGVYTTILDLSLYIPNLSTTIVGVVGAASKGPLNTPTYCSNILAFVLAFGNPNPDYMGPYAALQFLRYGRQMYYVRVAGAAAARAYVDMTEGLTPASITSTLAGPYTIVSAANNVLRMKFNDDAEFQVLTLIKGVKTASQLAVELQAFIDGGAGNTDVAVTSASGYLRFTSLTLGAASLVEFDTTANGSTANALFGFSTSGASYAGAAATGGAVTGSASGADPFNIGSGNNSLVVTIDGTEFDISLTEGLTQTAENVADDINGTAAPVLFSTVATAAKVTVDGNDVVRITSISTGDTSTVLVGASPAQALLGFDTTLHIGVNQVAAAGTGTVLGPFALGANASLKIITDRGTSRTIALSPAGSMSATALVALINTVVGPYGYNEALATVTVDGKVKITSLTYGDESFIQADDTGTGHFALNLSTVEAQGTGASATVSVTVTALTKGSYGNSLIIQAVAGQNPGTFKLLVYDGVQIVEVWDNLTKADANADSFLETVINDNSTWITVANDEATASFPDFTVTFPLTRGDDDTESLTDGDYIGSVSAGVKTGMQLFANQEDYDLNLLMVPGISSAAVINEMLLVCSTRGDCMAIVDPPLGLTVQQVTDWHNGYGAYNDHAAFNSLYGALYWPWLQIYDAVNKQKVWVPPSGLVSGVYAYTDYTTETWFAPAGLNRGHLLQPLQVEHSPDLGERDLLYGNQNAVNPIVNFQKDGITVWGQRSLQRKPSALDRVNVVRLVLYLRKVIATAVKYLVFEPNDPVTWATFTALVAPYLESVKQRRGLMDYKVICDASTNPPDAMDRNEMHAVCALKPTKAAEFIEIKFAVVNQGARFEDLTY